MLKQCNSVHSVIHSAPHYLSFRVVLSAMQYGKDSTMPLTFPIPEDLVNTSIQNLPAAITIPSELFREGLQEGNNDVHGYLSTYACHAWSSSRHNLLN